MFWYFVYCLLWLPIKILFRLKIKGRENLDFNGSAIIVSNHKSYIDPIVLGLAIRKPISFVAKKELFNYPVFSSVIRMLYAFPIRRGELDREVIREGLKRLESGFHLGIFPEGTRIHQKDLGPFKKGVVLFLKAGDYPVLPVAIKGTERLIRWWGFFPVFNKIEVRIGRPLKFDLTNITKKEAIEKLKNSVEELYHDRDC